MHYNWFWLERALGDPGIDFRLVRRGPRRGLVGVVGFGVSAFGAHEAIDLDPSSCLDEFGGIFHIAVDRKAAGQGIGPATITAATTMLAEKMPWLRAIRVAHHPENVAAAKLHAKLGFAAVGGKIDDETGISDVMQKLAGPALARLLAG